jgi:hypothetical protein
MPLKMRPTGLSSGFYKDTVDNSVFCGEWCIGRIYETRSGPADLRWFWAFHAPSKPGTLRISNHVATLEVAKSEFEASWKQWKAWAKMEETD